MYYTSAAQKRPRSAQETTMEGKLSDEIAFFYGLNKRRPACSSRQGKSWIRSCLNVRDLS